MMTVVKGLKCFIAFTSQQCVVVEECGGSCSNWRGYECKGRWGNWVWWGSNIFSQEFVVVGKDIWWRNVTQQ